MEDFCIKKFSWTTPEEIVAFLRSKGLNTTFNGRTTGNYYGAMNGRDCCRAEPWAVIISINTDYEIY